jgi:twinkle protein
MLQKLQELGIDVGSATSGTKKTWCPVCYARKGDKKEKDLSVNIDLGAYKCHSSSCNFQGRVSNKEYKRPEFKKNVAGVPTELAVFFQNRGISQETISAENVTFSNGEIYFNYFKNGSIINYKKRSISEKKFSQFPEAEKALYRHDSLMDKKTCIIVEGEIDALTWAELGFGKNHAIVSLDQGAGQAGSVLDGKLECITNASLKLNGIEMFYLAGDNDEPGEYTFKEIARRLGEFRCRKITFGKHKDSNEKLTSLIKNGVSRDQIEETFRNLIYNAEPYPVLGVIPLDDALIEVMIDEYKNGVYKGIEIEGSPLNAFWTVLDGEITLMTGYPGDGKSQMLRFIACAHAMQNGLKFACYCVEDNPAQYFYSDLAKIFMGKPIDEKFGANRATESEYRSALAFVRNHFYYIHPEPDPRTGIYPLPDNRWINEKIAFLRLQYGVDSYIKDPWNKIYHNMAVSGGREDLYLQNELSMEKMFAANYKACLYTWHPTKANKGKDGTLPEADQYSLSGGAMANNAFDNILVVSRPDRALDPSSKRVQLSIKKVKKQGVRGGEGSIEYNFYRSTNRYEVIHDDMGFEKPETYAKSDDQFKISDRNIPNELFDEIPF